MLVGSSKAAARLASAAGPARSLSQPTATFSSSPLSTASDPTTTFRQDPHRRLVNRIVQLAVRGSQENQLDPIEEDASRQGRTAPRTGFKPTPRRATPSRQESWATRSAGASNKRRGRLVEYNGDHLRQHPPRSASSASAIGRQGATRSLSTRTKPSYFISTTRAGGVQPSLRTFSSTSASSRIRLDESSLAAADDSIGGGDGGGLFEDAEVGGVVPARKEAKQRDLRPGDWVDTSRSGQQVCGIFICRSFATVRRITILAGSGELVDVSLDDIIASVPSLVSAKDAKRLEERLAEVIAASKADVVEGSTEVAAEVTASEWPETLELLQALRALEIDIERETQVLATNGVHDVYRVVLAAHDRGGVAASSAPSSVTVGTALAALRVPSRPNRARHLALTRILLSQPQHFIADPLALRQTGRFDLRPPDEVDRFETVRHWVREQSSELQAWAEKCARVRQWAREQKTDVQDSATLPLFELPRDDSFTWTASDRTIFDFLRDTLARERLLQAQPHLAIAPALVKLVDATSTRLGLPAWEETREVQRSRLREFLAEVGVVAEWEDWVAHEKTKGLRSWDELGSVVADKLAQAPRASSSPSKSPSRTEFYAADPHDSVRRDFGPATVFTIDDPSASELDDGISIASGPAHTDGSPTWWVHVHIADPTALLHPRHLLANLARLRDHTVYFPEYTWPMLPDSFTVGEKLSLGANGDEGQRVLSLGMHIADATGEILETDVQAGIVRDVRRLTYGAVENVLGYTAKRNGRTISNREATAAEMEAETARSRRPTDDANLPADAVAIQQLSTLHGLAKKLMRRRVESSALFWQFPSSSVSVSPKPIRPHFETRAEPMFYARSPRVSVRLPSPTDHSYVDSPANLLVSEMMVAANRAAARFAVEKGIAVPFRQQGAPTADPKDLEVIMALRNPESGIAPAVDVLKRRIEFLPGETTPTPGPHWPMGINDEFGYLRVTSPLRRYSDLFSHYQLKSALLPTSAKGSFAPRASLPAVLTQIEGFNSAAKARHRLDGASQSFWSLWVLKQKFELLQRSSGSLTDEDQITVDLLANGLTSLAYRVPTHHSADNVYVQSVLIPQLGVRGSLRLDKADQGAAIGEEIPVKIEDISLGPRSRIVVGLRR